MGRKRSPWWPTLTKKKIAAFENLGEFMADSVNTTSREVTLRWRLLYELSIAAAHSGIALQTFLPDVDREGFDIVLSDDDETRPFQLKATRRVVDSLFEIDGVHCGTLRPSYDVAENIGFQPTQSGTGQHGCIVLTEIFGVDNVEPRLDVRYWITDAHILAALSRTEGLVPGAPPEAQHDASALIEVLQQGTHHDRVNLRGSCFIPAASAGALLALAGFHSHITTPPWQYNLGELMRVRTTEETARLATSGMTAAEVQNRWDQARVEQVRVTFRNCLKWPDARGSV